MKLYCPSCGAPVEFRYDDSFVRVCDACHTGLSRTDRGIDTLGQLADLPPPRSGLSLFDRGSYQGVGFTLTGRTQYRHPAGGTWEEWYLHFDDGRWGWLAQSQGSWVLTFRSSKQLSPPPFESLRPGLEIPVEGIGSLTVGECSVGTLEGAEGEIPFEFSVGDESRFADLAAGRGRFATLDYGPEGFAGAPVLYVGSTATPQELGLRFEQDEFAAAAGTGERLTCPHCGGGVELRVPGSSQSVACEYCGSVLECDGPLRVLAQQELQRPPESPISLGDSCEFYGDRFVVTGRLRRRGHYEDSYTFEWDEFLLHSPEAGYRWLAVSNHHYNFVTPLAPGSVRDADTSHPLYDGRRFKQVEECVAEVCGVWGEFYWKVEVGERVFASEFAASPALLSREQSKSEENWSLGIYQQPKDVARAFDNEGITDQRSDAAANQPFPHRRAVTFGLYHLLGFLLVSVFVGMCASSKEVYSASLRFSETASGATLKGVLFTEPFELRADKNVEVTLSKPLNQAWAFIVGDLTHEESGQVQSFSLELSRYSGGSGEDAWQEGSTTLSRVLPGGEAGKYVLRLQMETPARQSPELRVKVAQDVFVWSLFGWAFALLLVPWVLIVIWWARFGSSSSEDG